MAREGFPVVVHIVLRRPVDGAVCLMRRRNTGFMDGYYALPGGHLQAGERVSAAAQRELLEECGVHSARLRPLACLPYRTFDRAAPVADGVEPIVTQQGMNIVFEADSFDRAPVINEPEFADDLMWWLPNTKAPRMAAWVAPVVEMSPGEQWYVEFDWPPTAN